MTNAKYRMPRNLQESSAQTIENMDMHSYSKSWPSQRSNTPTLKPDQELSMLSHVKMIFRIGGLASAAGGGDKKYDF